MHYRRFNVIVNNHHMMIRINGFRVWTLTGTGASTGTRAAAPTTSVPIHTTDQRPSQRLATCYIIISIDAMTSVPIHTMDQRPSQRLAKCYIIISIDAMTSVPIHATDERPSQRLAKC